MAESYIHEINIGNVRLKNNVFLAPLAGVADSAFRTVCMEQGAGLCFSEMISAKGLHYGSEGSRRLAYHTALEQPFAVQIFGREPELMADAAECFVREYGAAVIDINMGCPVPKVCGNREGSFLMTEPQLVGEIVAAVAQRAGVPVTVKMRRGYKRDNETAPEIAKICEQAGAAAVTVHGRFRDQMYSGTSDTGVIKRVREAVNIPVIASGDVVSRESAARVFAETGCDAVMIGRGALGNPWIFNSIVNGIDIDPTAEMIREVSGRQLALEIAEKGEAVAVREMKRHFAWYMKGRKNAAALRNMAFTAESIEEFNAILDSLE